MEAVLCDAPERCNQGTDCAVKNIRIMGGAEEAGFVGRWGEVDAFVHGGVEEFRELFRFARLNVGEGLDLFPAKEYGEHGTGLIDAQRDAQGFGLRAKRFGDPGASGFESFENPRIELL